MPEGHQIKEAAELSGVKPTTLRMWESRYGWPKPVIQANGYRSYSAKLIDQIKLVAYLSGKGQPIAEAIQTVLRSKP